MDLHVYAMKPCIIGTLKTAVGYKSVVCGEVIARMCLCVCLHD